MVDLAMDDKEAAISYVALWWSDQIKSWQLLSLGRTEKEINERVKFWQSKGVEDIKLISVGSLRNV